MALALSHPRHGYYRSRDPFGAQGDFVTAPEISQMFGELIGLWAADCWARMGEPARFAFVELGPGRGTLMADALRAARIVPRFLEAAQVHLVETSEILRARQRDTLAQAGTMAAMPVTWHEGFAEIPEAPLILIANEFFDALPIRQYMRARGALARAPDRARRQWRACLRALGENRDGPSARCAGRRDPRDVPGRARAHPRDRRAARLEQRRGPPHRLWPSSARVWRYAPGRAAARVRRSAPRAGGSRPYGPCRFRRARPGRPGRGSRAARPGDARRVSACTRHRGARTKAEGKMPARPQAAAIDAALARLIGEAPGEMGALFKAMAISSPSLPSLAGFDAPTDSPRASRG